MNFEYVVDYEVWDEHGPVKWGTHTVGYVGDEPPSAKAFAEETAKSIASYSSADPRSVRIKGIFKL